MFLRYRNSSNAFSYISVFIQRDLQTDVERVPSGIGWCFPDPCDFFSYIYSSTLDSLSIGTFLKQNLTCQSTFHSSLNSLVNMLSYIYLFIKRKRGFLEKQFLDELLLFLILLYVMVEQGLSHNVLSF